MPQPRRLECRATPGRPHVTVLPAELIAQSAGRLKVVALLYALVFFVAGPLPFLFTPDARADFFASTARWLPPALSIVTACLVAAIAAGSRVQGAWLVRLGLVFQVLGSFGIAAAEYLDPVQHATMPPDAGLSWVAVWMLSFTVIVPSPPRSALMAGLASASAVPIVSAVAIALAPSLAIASGRFVPYVVMPYLLVMLVAYVAARLIYRLGLDLERARDLGSYTLMERLGQGGMGEVWSARHRLLARPAAIKLIRTEMLGHAGESRQVELRARFEREAQTTARLQSPHTIHLFDYGVADDGAFYYVMELLDGFDLKTLIERFGPLPVERVVHLLRQVCHSLAEAHAAGLVHRDVTPANVFVCRYGRDVDFVKVLDFGLVKRQAWATDGDPSLTRADVAGGTPAFMSPEQALAERPLDGRADIYAVGCLAYWLVTGELVFAKATPMATLVAHTQAVPDPPSRRTELAIPAAFDALVLECLAKSPDDRPATAEDLACRFDALEGLARWTPRQAHAWWDIHRPAGSGPLPAAASAVS